MRVVTMTASRTNITFRRAIPADADAISEAALESQREFAIHEYSQAGRERIRRLTLPDAIRQNIERGDIFVIAEYEAQLVGSIGIRELGHIDQMFVVKQWHRRGIASELWRLARQACLDAGGSGEFSLNASAYAVPVYLRWGFEIVGEVQDRGGIITTPMRLQGAGQPAVSQPIDDRQIALASGNTCHLKNIRNDLIRNYYLLAFPVEQGQPSPSEVSEMLILGIGQAQELAQARLGDREAFTILYSGYSARREKGWHVHIVLLGNRWRKAWLYAVLAGKNFLQALGLRKDDAPRLRK